MNTKKYYFLPFLDNLLAVLVSLLFTMFFGSWFQNKIFGIAMGVIMTLVMCGFIYSRMWKLSRKNTRYGYGLKQSDGVKFILPLAIFSLALILFFFLAQTNVIPLKDIVCNGVYSVLVFLLVRVFAKYTCVAFSALPCAGASVRLAGI